jgi:hypothetical protein
MKRYPVNKYRIAGHYPTLIYSGMEQSKILIMYLWALRQIQLWLQMI